MLVFTNCKINLGLSIVNKRSDGFHNVETVFYPINIPDALEIIKGSPLQEAISFSQTGNAIDVVQSENICVKAYDLLKKDFPYLPQIKMHLHKAIPAGAGLGGGSADGAFTLQLLNKQFDLGISNNQLIDYALQLGSDCPFFINNNPCFASGRGEVLENIALNLAGHKLILINPSIHINTGWAFSKIIPQVPMFFIKEIIKQPISTWKNNLVNDFEAPVFEAYPTIKTIKEKLYNAGALYASMSGSGSSVYGIFNKEQDLNFSFPSNYFAKTILL